MHEAEAQAEAARDDRFGVAWNAATLMLQGHVDDAIEMLETIASTQADEWSRSVLAGCAQLRLAQDEARLALHLTRQGHREAADRYWDRAIGAAESASHALERLCEGPLYLRLPDPWPHIVQLFRDCLEDRRREAADSPAA
jgi:hypothetical protein